MQSEAMVAILQRQALKASLRAQHHPPFRLTREGTKPIFYACTFCGGVVDSNYADRFMSVEEISLEEFSKRELCMPALAEQAAEKGTVLVRPNRVELLVGNGLELVENALGLA